MKRTLYLKLAAGYALFLLLSFLSVTLFMYHIAYQHMEKQEASNLYREASAISNTYGANYVSHTLTQENFRLQLSALSKYSNVTIWIMDMKGNINITSSGNVKRIENFNILDFGNNYYQTGTFYDYFSGDTLSVYAPITVNYKVRGYVLIHKSVSDIINTANAITTIGYQTLALIGLAGLLLFALFTFVVYLPIRKLINAADAYAQGDYKVHAEVHSNDELGYLAATMNCMANDLHTLEEDQKKFISNVSHDFRSPLTSIKGYIEAMLDGTIPVEMQEKYLNIILFETERLNKLTHSLLELNKFGSRGAMLNITAFDINQTIKTTVQTFEGICTKKHLSFDLTLTGEELNVRADYGKIQQILYNLIDNAIKFSHANSTIYIETTTKNEKVFVSVKDTGIGIPKDSINKIWERFYKSDLSRGKDKKGTGLGLAIVKEIINAHNENINCISTEGVGTEFIFTLPLSTK